VNLSWERFGAVYGRIVESYYASFDQDRIMQAAIDGMLDELDSYSQFYDEEGLRQLRQDTTGKFAGLGITVAIKDHYPVVIAPIEETPAYRAGLLPGDLIVAIEDQDTRGMTLEEVVDALRGDPGTEVRIKVAHKAGEILARELTIRREVIRIKSVTLVEEIEPGIGYISMRQTRFSEETAAEVEEALNGLKSRRIKGVILDLRGNPGGLLSQATQVADLFLPQGAPIVSIREQNGRREEVKHSQKRPVAEGLPLVVLIDKGSASASEIVAGAIQDNDRGIILGMTSFGKGSVQTIFELHEIGDSALKLTTALYYTPSGRSIHRETHSVSRRLFLPVPLGEVELPAEPTLEIILQATDPQQAEAGLRARFDLEEEEAKEILATSLSDLVGRFTSTEDPDLSEDSLASAKREVFYTQKGRKVYGEGGITPDIHVQADRPPAYLVEMERRRLFFDFVVDYVSADTTRIDSYSQAELEEDMIEEFRGFLLRTDAVPSYRRVARDRLEALGNLAQEMGWGEFVQEAIAKLEGALEEELSRGFTAKLKPYIRAALRRELALRLHGKRAQLRASLEEDSQLEAAINLLQNGDRYDRILSNGAS